MLSPKSSRDWAASPRKLRKPPRRNNPSLTARQLDDAGDTQAIATLIRLTTRSHHALATRPLSQQEASRAVSLRDYGITAMGEPSCGILLRDTPQGVRQGGHQLVERAG